MNVQFPQGRMNTRKLVKRCIHCEKYPYKVTMRVHLSKCEANPENSEESEET